MKRYIFNLKPMAKPRMTKRDQWKKRRIVNYYNAFKDHLRIQANQQGLEKLPGNIFSLVFYLPMPDSWSKKKRNNLRFHPHQQRPDLDNLLKGFQDTFGEDAHIYQISNGLGKYWDIEGSIIMMIDGEEDNDIRHP